MLKNLQTKEKYAENYKQKISAASDFFLISQENGQSLAIANELNDKIESSIDKLPKQCREIFKLSRYEGLKNKEIAEELGVSLNTVIKRISITLERLRKSLRQYLTVLF